MGASLCNLFGICGKTKRGFDQQADDTVDFQIMSSKWDSLDSFAVETARSQVRAKPHLYSNICFDDNMLDQMMTDGPSCEDPCDLLGCSGRGQETADVDGPPDPEMQKYERSYEIATKPAPQMRKKLAGSQHKKRVPRPTMTRDRSNSDGSNHDTAREAYGVGSMQRPKNKSYQDHRRVPRGMPRGMPKGVVANVIPLRRIAEVNSDMEQSSVNQVNSRASSMLRSGGGSSMLRSGTGSSGTEPNCSTQFNFNPQQLTKKLANGQLGNGPQVFESAARYQFSPVTTDSSVEYVDHDLEGEAAHIETYMIELITPETPSLTEESKDIDVEMIEFVERTPRKKTRKSQHIKRDASSRQQQDGHYD